jgi:hypothetical protein
MESSAPGGRRRPLVGGPLVLTPEACTDTEDAAERAIIWALELLREDELALIACGNEDGIAFGRWLTNPLSQRRTVHDLLRKSLPELVKGLVRTRLTANYRPHGRFTQVASVAEAAGMDRGDVFRAWAPRGLLLIHLAHAYLVSVEDQPRLAALIFYSHSCLPYGVGLRCDPAHSEADEMALAEALAELQPFGFTAVPSSHADHFEFFLRIATGAREVLERARGGSRVCGRARVDPAVVLDRAFPRWLTVGALPLGVHELGPQNPAETHMPGGDAELLRVATRHGMWPVYVLFDTAEVAASERGLRDLAFSDGENLYSGRQFVELVCSPGRREIPGLRREPGHVLRSLRNLPELAELGVDIDPTKVDWLWRRQGLRLLEGRGQGFPQSLLVRSTETRTTGYVVLSDLNNSELRANAITRADLHFLSATDNTRSECVGRVFGEYELHSLKTWKFNTRSWLRLAALLSNSPVVDVGRRRQSGRR